MSRPQDSNPATVPRFFSRTVKVTKSSPLKKLQPGQVVTLPSVLGTSEPEVDRRRPDPVVEVGDMARCNASIALVISQVWASNACTQLMHLANPVVFNRARNPPSLWLRTACRLQKARNLAEGECEFSLDLKIRPRQQRKWLIDRKFL
jgi:hypothetical protein